MDDKRKKYRMLKTADGSEDGITVNTYDEGEVYELGADLATNFSHQGVVEEVSGRAKATNPADERETKVFTPGESKEGEAGIPLEQQGIEELVALGRDHYGLDLNSTMSLEDARAAIKEAQDKAGASDALTTETSTTSRRRK